MKPHWIRTALALTALACLALAAGQGRGLLLINESASLPRGLYVLSPAEIRRGAVVAVPQPDAGRAYLETLGMPREVLLIKRVAALGGERACVRDGRVFTPLGDRPVLARDRRGAVLAGWGGCRRLAADEIFLLGDTAASFDSRYFGPVSRSAIRGVYQEVLTW